ncbi:MAG TPA: beta-N-acetylhexosaminidase, partial [Chitinophagaceae bacterium]
MNVFRLPALLCLLGCFFTKAFAQHHPAEQQSSVRIVPEPVMVNPGKGFFRLTPGVKIIVPASNEQLRETADLFSREIAAPTGYHLKVAGAPAKNEKAIRLTLNTLPDNTIGDEGYRLEVSPARIDIHANKPAGIFYGLQTLMQLVPPGLSAGRPGVNGKTGIARVNLDIPCVHIMDYPRFGWRGLMLDVSRHFFSKDFVKAYIDEMVKYKYNVFHWHLTDDNGWRIEIKGLPELTETGAWRVPRTGRWGEFKAPRPGEKATYGGYYTQEDIKEIVQYAKDRFVNILPEIDVPGHSLAAIVSYPGLSCTPGAENYPVNSGESFMDWSHGAPPIALVDNTLCPANEKVYAFLDTVITQVAKLFPFEYIHLGGDECPKNFWEKSDAVKALM